MFPGALGRLDSVALGAAPAQDLRLQLIRVAQKGLPVVERDEGEDQTVTALLMIRMSLHIILTRERTGGEVDENDRGKSHRRPRKPLQEEILRR